jgi:hypothetical protein
VSLQIVPRRKWTSYRPALSTIADPVGHVFIHHDVFRNLGPKTTAAEEEKTLRDVEAFHKNSRGMVAGAYSFWIPPSGRVYVLRGWRAAGGHTYSYKLGNFNHKSYGICFAGNFQEAKPTKAALEAAQQLIALGKVKGFIRQDAKILGHRDVGAMSGGTACPGDNLYAKMPRIRSHPRHEHSHPHPHRLDGHHHHGGKGHRIHPHLSKKEPDAHHHKY